MSSAKTMKSKVTGNKWAMTFFLQHKPLLLKATIRKVQAKLCFAHHPIQPSSYSSRSARNQFTSALTYQINTSANPGDLSLTGKVAAGNVRGAR